MQRALTHPALTHLAPLCLSGGVWRRTGTAVLASRQRDVIMKSVRWNERLQARLGSTRQEIARFCRSHAVSELAVFGSILRDDFTKDSDIDLLVSFTPDARIGFIELGRMQEELERLVGRPVDLVPKGGVKPLIRDQVIASSELLYAV